MTLIIEEKKWLSNISKDELNKVFEDYFIWKAMIKLKNDFFA